MHRVHRLIVAVAIAGAASPAAIWAASTAAATSATAASSTSDLAAQCQQVADSDTSCRDLSKADCQKLLQQCADYYDQQSQQIAGDISKTQQQKTTLRGQVSTLQRKIQGLEYQITQGTLMVKDLNSQITDTQASIDNTNGKIQDSQSQIADILRAIYEQDRQPVLAVLLQGNLSDFFGDIAKLENLNTRVSDLLASTTDLKSYLQSQENKISGEKVSLQQTIQTQSLQKQQQQAQKQQQQQYLTLTEAQYQQQVQTKQAIDQKAAAIKTRIFNLLGVSKAPDFEEAYNIAKYANSVTGVRPALILAILTQESNLGKNVGQCYLKDPDTGSGVKISTGAYSPRTMSPSRDVPIFLQITQSLGLDPYSTPVSCVIYYNGRPYGWGGAMGPGQFIPSTWQNLGYAQKVSAVTGKTANPWNITDAFLATGLLLRDNGAAAGTASAEFNAAMRYYCGGGCSAYDRFYGNSVMSIAAQYEQDIAAIGG